MLKQWLNKYYDEHTQIPLDDKFAIDELGEEIARELKEGRRVRLLINGKPIELTKSGTKVIVVGELAC